MPITSLIIGIAPEQAGTVIEQIAEMPCVEVSDVRGGSIVIITDTPSTEKDQSTWDAINSIPDVLSSDIIYHNFEDMELESHA